MKTTCIIFVLFLSINVSFGQNLSVFDVDASNFPTIKAKFFAFDKDGKQITTLNPSDFEVKENGHSRAVTNVSCPPPQPLQIVSIAMSLDVSGSMSSSKFGEIPVELGKTTAKELCSLIDMPPSEFALQTCDSRALIIQDFTTNKSKILGAIEPIKASGGNDFFEHLSNKLTGLLNIAKKGKNKRVAVIYTDAWWYALTQQELQQCKDTCSKYNITFYAIIYSRPEAEPNGIKKSLQELTDFTGGYLYDGVTSTTAAKDIGLKLQQSAQGGDPCNIEWQSGTSCAAGITNVELQITNLGIKTTTSYQSPSTSIAKLEFNPTSVKFPNPEIGVKVEKKVTVTARNADFTITNITSNNAAFEIMPHSFSLYTGQSLELTVSFLPIDSGYAFARFDLENDICPTKYYASGGFSGIKPKIKTLKLLHPNGGEEFVIGSDTVITWEGIPESDTVQLEYTIDNGATWKTITYKASGLQYIWNNIPKPPSSQCKVRIKHRIKDSDKENAGYLLHTLSGHTSYVYDVSWSPDGSRLATSSQDATAIIWDAASGTTLHTLSGHTGFLTTVRWSPDGSRLATSSIDKTARIWDAETGVTLHTLKGHTYNVNDVCWSPDGSRVATTSDSSARIWDAASGTTLHTLSGHTSTVNVVNWSPDGTRLSTASYDSSARIWDAASGVALYTLSGHSGWVLDVSWSLDGSSVVTTSLDRTAKIWDAKTGATLHTLNGHTGTVSAVSWSPDFTHLATASGDGTAKIWNAEIGDLIHTLKGHTGYVTAVRWSPDGSRIVTASGDSTARIWDTETGVTLNTLSGHTDFVWDVRWSPDGFCIATSSADRTAKIWYAGGGYTELQEDESDNVFSIVAPSPSAIDINMGQCLFSFPKDSVINAFITNTGMYKVRVDSIYFQGADADAFSLVSGFPKYVVDANQVHLAEFRFIPNRVGIHSAEIVIVTQAETLTKKIRGEGIKPFLSIENNLIDFGEVYLGYFKDSIKVTTIKNIGNSSIQITNTKHNLPNDVDFSTLSSGGNFTLQSGEEAQMDLRFKPSDVGRTSGTLEFHYNGFGSPLILNLFGEGVDRKLSIMNEFTNFPTLLCNGYESKPLIIKNTGQTKLTINDIKIINDIESNFSTDSTFPFELQANDEISLNIYFKAEKPGEKTALLELISNSYPNPIIEIPLKGKKEIVNYESDVSIIDYKVLMYNTQGFSSFILTNTGTIHNTYSISFEGIYYINPKIVTLNPNEQVSIEVTFNGSSENISFNDNLIMKDDLCEIEKQILVTGSVSTSSAEIKIPIFEAYPGDEIEIPIILQKQQNLIFSSATHLKVELGFNPTILSPIDYPIQKIDEKNAKMSIENLPIDKLDGEVLTNIRFRVGLGNAESCKLTLSNAETVGGAAEIQVIDGTFKLLGICYEGGARLLNPNNKVDLLQISPNPNDGNLSISINLIEEGFSTLSIYNSNGQLMYEQNITGTTGKIDLNIDTKEYGNGLYFVSLQTPTIRKVKQMVVFK